MIHRHSANLCVGWFIFGMLFFIVVVPFFLWCAERVLGLDGKK